MALLSPLEEEEEEEEEEEPPRPLCSPT